MRTPLVIALTVILNGAGDLCLSLGMKEVGEIRRWSLPDLASMALAAMRNREVWMGVILLTLFLVLFLLLLSWADYSYVQPATASGYAVVPLLGYVVGGEHVTLLRWIGVVLICAGVLLVGQTPQRSTGGG